MGGSLRQQTKWLVYRNFLLKKRMYKLTIQEVLLPVYFIVILALTRMGIRPTTNEAVPYFPPHDLMNTSAFLPDTTLALAASPNSTDVEKVMDQISAMLNMEYIMFEDEESMLAKYANNASLFSVGIIFNSDLSQNHTYAIRTPFEMLPSNLDLYNHNNQGCRQPDGLGTCPAHQYLYTGIAALQTVIDHSLITFSVPNTTLPQIQMQLLPKPEYTTDITQLQIMNSLYLVMAFSPFLGILISSLVYEKEKKIKETMKMMGLNSLAFCSVVIDDDRAELFISSIAYWLLDLVWPIGYSIQYDLLVVSIRMAYWLLNPVWLIGYWIQYGLLVIGSSMAYWSLNPVWPIGH
uniref:ATP-binding cassette sub-family A member 5-like n=1 Tax=Saccoglossus kowalevskii TaxID=10224 RepID=A0ABM0M9Y9_SACKO|nr:PREDICTED: ATP-binding cassette sub-family A member 5-like [Saccoglossus kowalevskii]